MRGDGKFWDINRDEKRRAEQSRAGRVSECRSQYQLIIQLHFGSPRTFARSFFR